MKKIFSILFVLVILTACTSSGYKTVDANEIKSLIDNGATIIDVRTSDEYNSGHIKNAINIALDNIENIDIEKDKTVIVYCASGMRSAEAAKKLIDMGYTLVYNLDGGLINWGFDLEE